jgi:tRNA (guanine37-N1)-methyltransferase
MRFTVLTLFPEMFAALQAGGIIKRSAESRIISIETIDIRAFATDRHRTVDDRPYGGGCGMVMKPEPLAKAIRIAKDNRPSAYTILLTPQGRIFDQGVAQALAKCSELILVCGRYEGVDERVCERLVDMELSIGDFVLTGGELGAMVVIDAVSRLIPGALGNDRSAQDDSFATGMLEHPQYTRPDCFEGDSVPDILLSGDHGQIARWRRQASLIRTLLKRPDLLERQQLEEDDLTCLKAFQKRLECIFGKKTAGS